MCVICWLREIIRKEGKKGEVERFDLVFIFDKFFEGVSEVQLRLYMPSMGFTQSDWRWKYGSDSLG